MGKIIKRWKLIDGEMWQYHGYRSDHHEAHTRCSNLKWDLYYRRHPITKVKWDGTTDRYNIYVRPSVD